MKKEILIWEPFWQRVRLVSVGKESREHHTSLNLFDTLYIASRINIMLCLVRNRDAELW